MFHLLENRTKQCVTGLCDPCNIGSKAFASIERKVVQEYTKSDMN